MGLNFNIDGTFLIQKMTFRIPKTQLFAGGRYEYLASDIAFSHPEIYRGFRR